MSLGYLNIMGINNGYKLKGIGFGSITTHAKHTFFMLRAPSEAIPTMHRIILDVNAEA